ncbi:hypothetical protein I6N90_05180 [Paenibacillus sp. GSMTC-2017]|uniref:hypothetical protein n=1 Tax=Paenibacillus sp. GSMTC-2017 TaxID=2794350 RepID=UPI0018D7FEC4|nr:hypothetical protein [Paenibacillus sp. GSMTC-2017]MBH5317201.1 hypothetical protein [Paenibacillus sp. GSMTC-2017]
MFEKFDEYLLGHFSVDYWYDSGFEFAREMLAKFNHDDWTKLSENVLSKPTDWQIRFAYCADSDLNDEVIIESLILLASLEDEELFITCVDSLRVIVPPNHLETVFKKTPIMERIEQLLPTSGAATKRVFEHIIAMVQK